MCHHWEKRDTLGSVPVLLPECMVWCPPPVYDQAPLLQVSLAGSPPRHHDLELLVYFGDPTAVSAVVEKGDPEAPPGECSWGGKMDAPLGFRRHGGLWEGLENSGGGEISLDTGMGMGGIQMG